MEKLIELFRSDIQLLKSYSHVERGKLDCPIVVFGGREDPSTTEEGLSEWQRYTTGEFRLMMVPGKHMFHMFSNSSRKLLLEAIFQELMAHLGKSKQLI